MMDKDTLKTEIRSAFLDVSFPGSGNITNSYESDESASLETEFGDKDDWTTLEADFLDQAPQGFASALSFFSHQAFRFYLPAYLLSDIDEKLWLSSTSPPEIPGGPKLSHGDVVFHLCHGLDDISRTQLINPRRYGNQTWLDYATPRFSSFTSRQAAAVVGYLEFKTGSEYLVGFEREAVKQALANYWRGQARRE